MLQFLRLIAIGFVVLGALPAAAQQTLEAVKKRGHLTCGVDGNLPGFSLFNAVEEWEGMDVDLCRGIAAAVFGDATKVQFVSVAAKDRFDKLAAGEFDVLARNSTVTLQRSAGLNVRFAVVNFFDGQAFVVPKKLNINQLAGVRGGNTASPRARPTNSTWTPGSAPGGSRRFRCRSIRQRRCMRASSPTVALP
jgi:general L-amino acid transport system substrate-binding protein